MVNMFKKKENVKELGKKEGERQKNINQPKFKIVVYKTLGRDVYQEINSFYATQQKDSSGSMFLVNDDQKFKESMTVSKHPDIIKLKDRLDIKKLSLEEQRKAITDKIEEQEKRIRSVKDGKINDEKVNIVEEQKRLRQLKVLKYIINHGDMGSYDSIDGQGFRQRFYLYDEGALTPLFWDRKTNSLFVAIDTAIKFYKADQDLINADYVDENKDKWAGFGKGLMVVLFVVLIIATGYLFIKNNDRASELDARAETIALAIQDSNFGQCIGSIATTNEKLLEIIDEYRVESGENTTNALNTKDTDLR